MNLGELRLLLSLIKKYSDRFYKDTTVLQADIERIIQNILNVQKFMAEAGFKLKNGVFTDDKAAFKDEMDGFSVNFDKAEQDRKDNP